jgi:hypothetical protein
MVEAAGVKVLSPINQKQAQQPIDRSILQSFRASESDLRSCTKFGIKRCQSVTAKVANGGK